MNDSLVDRIDALLPQTQCEDCGYAGCRPYAQAVAGGEAVDLCAPGGISVYDKIAGLVGRAGSAEKVQERYKPPTLAEIDQNACIGCMKCIRACPTDAIIGAKKSNHFVLALDCTGCGLCLPVCPVDCIDLVADFLTPKGRSSMADSYRELNHQKQDRKKKVDAGLVQRSSSDLLSDMQAIRRRGKDESTD